MISCSEVERVMTLVCVFQELFLKYQLEVPIDFGKKLTLEEIFQVLDELCETGIKLGTRLKLFPMNFYRFDIFRGFADYSH